MLTSSGVGKAPTFKESTGAVAASGITTSLINTSAVTTAKIAASAITTTLINATAVTAAKIATSAITTTKIAATAVTAAKIATSAVTTTKIAISAVTTAKIATSAITTTLINTGAITAAKIASGILIQEISFPAEAAYLPATNPAELTEDIGVGTKAGLSHGDFDDGTAEHLVWRGPVLDYDGGNIVLTGWAKAKTNPSAEKTIIFDIYAVGIANNETFDMAVTVDTGVDMTFTILFSELMPNQVDRDFSGASAWANVDVNAYDETGDLTLTATAANQYCTCPVASVPTTVGKRYTLEFDVANIVETWTVKSFDGTQTLGTVTANGANQQIEWVAETTGGLRIVSDETTSSGDFDNFSLTESDKVYKATATIDPANVADGDKIVLEYIRNVSDTLPGDAELIEISSSHERA